MKRAPIILGVIVLALVAIWFANERLGRRSEQSTADLRFNETILDDSSELAVSDIFDSEYSLEKT